MPQITTFVKNEYFTRWKQIRQPAAAIRWLIDNCPDEFLHEIPYGSPESLHEKLNEKKSPVSKAL